MRRLTAFCLLLLAACGPAEPPLREGPWRGEIALADRQVPFNFEVRRTRAGWDVAYLNGPERMPVEKVTLEGETLHLDFPSYSAQLAADLSGDTMTGEITLARRDGLHRLPFRAVHGPTHRFFPEPAARAADLGGRWAVRIESDGTIEEGIGLLEQQGSRLTGTIRQQFSDQRYLAGEVRDDALYLSTFDGNGVQLWLGTLGADGTLSGTFDSVTTRGARWTARRDGAVDLAEPATLTYLEPGERLRFTFPDLDGRLVSLDDERFRGKVTLVILAGSWCPTCHDEAKTMGPIYAEYAAQGLELVYLMYEYSPDFATAEPQMRAYRARYGITHPMLFVGASTRETRAESLPMLNDIVAFPTTIYVDRKGTVRRIHTAFPGPATGQAHEDYKREFRATVEALLAEPAP
jgi:thiol-disulfide isomerase/thioredoxin